MSQYDSSMKPTLGKVWLSLQLRLQIEQQFESSEVSQEQTRQIRVNYRGRKKQAVENVCELCFYLS